MSPEEFTRQLDAKANKVKKYANTRYPSVAGNIALRFINGNFRAQGFQGKTFEKWKKSKGTVLVKTGALRSGNYYTTQPGQTTLKNNSSYAKAHNEGFKGTVTVKAHSRNKYKKTRVGTGKFTKKGKERTKMLTAKAGENNIKTHTRKMNLPKRQFMPTTANDSPVLNKAITREVSRDINKLMQ